MIALFFLFLAQWGAPRIHGELLKLGFEVAQFSAAKYMVKRCEPALPRMAHLPA
jgi:hypothetical protein